MHKFTKGEATGAVKAFLDFILSADYGKEIEKQGYGVTAKMQVKRYAGLRIRRICVATTPRSTNMYAVVVVA